MSGNIIPNGPAEYRMTALSTGLRRVAERLAPDPAPDGELLARFLATRDEAAFASLVRRHASLVFGTCRRVLGNAADADDAFQAAFVVLVRKAHSLTDRTCVGNFLYGVAFHTALKARAMATKRRAKEAKATRPQPVGDGELTRLLDEELARLPDKYREPVVLCELEGVPRREAAGRLGIPEGTISSRLATAHRMLAKRLAARGFAAVAVAAVLADQTFAVSDSLTAAVVRAAVGGPPPAVTQLASEVSKMLLWNKLKAGAVLAGLVALLALGIGMGAKAFADDKPLAKAPVPAKDGKKPDDAKLLQGKWVTKAVTFDPPLPVPPGAKQEHAHHELTFADKELTWVTFIPSDPKTRSTQTKEFKLDQTTSPKELASGDMDCVYELDGDTLKVAMYFLTPGRPKGFNAKDSPPGRGNVILIELTREKEEADNSYSLKDGEMLKLIPAPFPKERDEVLPLIDVVARTRPDIYGKSCLSMAVEGGKPVTIQGGMSGPGSKPGDVGIRLADLLTVLLRYDLSPLSDPDWLLQSTVVVCDVLVKKDAKPQEWMPVLLKELKAKCGVDLVIEFREGEWEVIVISGKHTLKPVPPGSDVRKSMPSEVKMWTSEKRQHVLGQGDGTSRQLAGMVAQFLGRPVVDESDLVTNEVALSVGSYVIPPYKDKDRPVEGTPEAVFADLEKQTGLTFKLEKRKVKALVVAKADDPKAKSAEKEPKTDEPAWQAEFRKAYGLKDGQLVRRVAPAYPDCREEYFKDVWKNGVRAIPFEQWFAVFAWKDDWTDAKAVQTTMPIRPDVGVTLERLLDMTLKFAGTRLEADLTTRGYKVTGDFVVRAGADPEKAAAELEAVLRKECELPVKFSFRDSEEEVFVLGGKYEAKPLEGKKAGDVEVYAVYRNDGKTGGGGNGTLKELAAALERHVGKTVVLGKVEGEPKSVNWHFNDRNRPFTREEHDQDHDPATVLGNIAEQTGLKLSTEKRKVRLLVVEHEPLKK